MKELKIPIILFLTAVISAAFDQIQGTFFPHRYFVNDLKMIAPNYFSALVGRFGTLTLFVVIYFESTQSRKEILIALLLVIGWVIDFLIEGNRGWFDVRMPLYGEYAFGYRSLAFLIFGGVILKTILKGKFV